MNYGSVNVQVALSNDQHQWNHSYELLN